MKIRMVCMDCFQEGLEIDAGKEPPYIPSYPYWEFPTIELDKWPFIEFTCEKGHTSRLTLGVELYELLFQQATYCIMDGYYREAIGTYNAALERFLEYAIEIMVYGGTNELDFEKLWKNVQNQSERQLGAFYFLYASQFRELPRFLDTKKVELRNKVVHKGKLASKEEAKEFGEYVFEYIKEIHHSLVEKYGDNIHTYTIERMLRICKKDFDNAMKSPIYTSINGEEQAKGIGSASIPCFLNMDSVKCYSDCFLSSNQLDYGLIK